MHGSKSLTRIVGDIGEMFSYIFNLCDGLMPIAMLCNVPRGYFRGPPYKKSRFVGVVLSGGSR